MLMKIQSLGKLTGLCLLYGFLSTNAFAQQAQRSMQAWQDSLQTISQHIFTTQVEPERIEQNFVFVKTLVSALQTSHSFDFKFPELKTISILESPDQKFRVFSWNIRLHDDSYLYYGAIQWKTQDGALKLVPLLDKTFEIAQADLQQLPPSNWYGAQYYELIKHANSYILLGWKGHNAQVTQKVIEVLNISGDQVVFGKNIFADEPSLCRKIFNYTKQASMLLLYQAKSKQIVFDHLVPADPSLLGQFQYYGPDLSYDSYRLQGEQLQLKSNIDFTNPVHSREAEFIDPQAGPPSQRSGLFEFEYRNN